MTDASGTLAGIVERADAIYRDYSLPTVRDWKARTGGLAVGFMRTRTVPAKRQMANQLWVLRAPRRH